MADLKVRNLDDGVASILRERAKAKGVSMEEEIRRTLTESATAEREALVARLRALHAEQGASRGGREPDPDLDSVRLIREERDAWG